MLQLRLKGMAMAIALAYPLLSHAETTTDSPPPPATASGDAAAAPTSASGTTGAQDLGTVQVVTPRTKLDAARNSLSPDTGSSTYRLDRQAIQNLPLGEATPLNQVLLQAPGVVQDSYGQLHVRGDHANLQYRVNGIVIPEAISGFGQALDTRLADHINFLTGALPAQYGYRTAGIVDIHTKGDGLPNGGSVSYTGGSNGHAELSGDISGTQGALSYFLTGSVMRDNIGIENPTASRSADHDQTNQGKSFGYLSYLLTDDSRVNFMFGTANNRFQIPNTPGATPDPTAPKAPASYGQGADPGAFNANQRERNDFGVLSFQSKVGDAVDYQVAVFDRYTDVHYQPDPVGDLLFTGVAANVTRRNQASGLQTDASWRLNDAHTLRTGAFYQHERYGVNNSSQVFMLDGSGSPAGDPVPKQDNSSLSGDLWGLYGQDEWKLTKQLTLNYGARFDQANTVVKESQISPRLGLVYDLSHDTRVHVGYARYFTPPPTEKIDTKSVDKFVGTTNDIGSDANTAVKSERSNYYDAGISHQLTPKVTLGVDAYYRDVRHLQDEGQFGSAPIYSAFNYEKGRVYGIELSTSYHDRGWSAYGNVALSRAMAKNIETGQFNFEQDELDYISSHWVHLDHDQKLTGSAGLSYRWPSTLSISADALYGSGLRNGFANTEHLPSYTTFNVALARTLDLGTGIGKIDGRVSVLNLFDKTYELRDGTGIGVGAPQYGLRRSLYVSATKSF